MIEMIVFDDVVRDIIGSFHPSRPILTNTEIYAKILYLDPEYSIKRLRDRYRKWYENRDESYTMRVPISNSLQFSIIDDDHNPDTLHIHSWKDYREIRDRLHLGDGLDPSVINIYNQDIKEELVSYVKNVICHPSNMRAITYSDIYELNYSHTKQEPGEGMLDNIDEIVDEIKQYDKSFGLSKLYYRLYDQYTLAKKIDSKYISLIIDMLPRLSSLRYFILEREIYAIMDDGEIVTIAVEVDMETYYSIVANLYTGISTTEAEYYGGSNRIMLDTYCDTLLL